MFVFALLKTTFCLIILNKLSSSNAVDVPSCHDVCNVISYQNPMSKYYGLCLLKCIDISGYPLDIPSEPMVGTPSDEGLQDGPTETIVRDERMWRRPSLRTNNFVRYGRNDAAAMRKPPRRPIYIRVGRSGAFDGEASQVNDQEASKRASRFIRIGKSGNLFETGSNDELGFGMPFEQNDFEKRNSILPSKYVRIGKRSDDRAASENEH